MLLPALLLATFASIPVQTPAAPPSAFEMAHQPLDCVVADKHPRLEARMPPGIDVATARVFFQGASPEWYSTPMKAEGPVFVGILPSPKRSLKEFHYYIEATSRSLETSRTADRATRVVASPGECRGLVAASAISSASILVQGPAGAAAVPAGFAPAGLVAAGGGISATTLAVGAAVVGAGAVAVTQVTGGSDYYGAVGGTYTLNFGGCQRVMRYTGTLVISLSGDGGEASSDGGRYETLSSTCPNGPQAGNVLNAGFPTGPITRSGDSISYSATEVNGINTGTATFTGTLAGNTITGTFTYTERIEGASGGYTSNTSLTKR